MASGKRVVSQESRNRWKINAIRIQVLEVVRPCSGSQNASAMHRIKNTRLEMRWETQRPVAGPKARVNSEQCSIIVPHICLITTAITVRKLDIKVQHLVSSCSDTLSC